MQITTKEAKQTVKDTSQSSSGIRSGDEVNNTATILCNPQSRNLDTVTNLEDIPMEFLDPLVLTLMEDPVVLPSDNIMDRASIRNHISKFHIDPFSGRYLTEDMLVSDDCLKARIVEFSQSTTKGTLQTGTASNQSCQGAENDSDPNDECKGPRHRVISIINASNAKIPVGFLDALDSRLMVHPVILPSGRKVDRTVIHKHIRKSPVDPFSGRYLTVDMLVLDYDLGDRIFEFYITMKRRIGKATNQSSPGSQNNSDPNNSSEFMLDLDDVNPKNIPTEFLDPLVLRLMKDPVILPSFHIVDHAVIRKHISQFGVDPFSGRYLAGNMLLLNDDLKTRIEEFSSQWRSMQSTTKGTLQTGTASIQNSPGVQNDIDPNDNSEICLDIACIPMEFLDPLKKSTLMKDPVVLPSSRRVDLAVIRNHISMLRVDPFSGRYLTEDMLVSDYYLKARIEEFSSSLPGRSMTNTLSRAYCGHQMSSSD